MGSADPQRGPLLYQQVKMPTTSQCSEGHTSFLDSLCTPVLPLTAMAENTFNFSEPQFFSSIKWEELEYLHSTELFEE